MPNKPLKVWLAQIFLGIVVSIVAVFSIIAFILVPQALFIPGVIGFGLLMGWVVETLDDWSDEKKRAKRRNRYTWFDEETNQWRQGNG